jgi:hypothetical protein
MKKELRIFKVLLFTFNALYLYNYSCINKKGIKKMDYSKKQTELDIQKWVDSESKAYDTCGEYSYCCKCNKSESYPCACAYEKFYGCATTDNNYQTSTTTTKTKRTCTRKTTTSKSTTSKSKTPSTKKTTTRKTTKVAA